MFAWAPNHWAGLASTRTARQGWRMDIQARLDPTIAELLAVAVLPEIRSHDDIIAVRERGLFPDLPLSDLVERTDTEATGTPPVRVRIHRPVGWEAPLPCVVSLHPGGYVLGSYADDDIRHDRLCPKLGYVGVAVDYRLAPETPYPGPLEDAYTALRWVHQNAAGLGVDADRIGLLGVSGGGGLAGALALLARDRGEVPVAFQQLVYPMLDDRRSTPTSQWDAPIWTPVSNELGWSCYLGELFGRDDVPAYAAPARADDLSGLPPAFLCVGALDIFCDENITYAQRLNQAGVPVELHVYPGGPHGVDAFAGLAEVATRCARDQEEWLAGQLGS